MCLSCNLFFHDFLDPSLMKTVFSVLCKVKVPKMVKSLSDRLLMVGSIPWIDTRGSGYPWYKLGSF